VFELSDDHVGVDEYDVVAQTLTSHHHRSTNGRAELFRSRHRYAWPAEYDLMARIAGLTLQERWGDWQRSPFTAQSRSHVSVWRKPGSSSSDGSPGSGIRRGRPRASRRGDP
jgi:hypothetical protein